MSGSSIFSQDIFKNQDVQSMSISSVLAEDIQNIPSSFLSSGIASQYETVIDIDSNIYNVISIGEHLWFKENLKTTHYSDGSDVSGSGKYYWYDNNINNKKYDGAIYNLPAVNNSRNLCPAGWHISTTADWDRLESLFGGKKTAGGEIKKLGDKDFTGILSGYMYSMDYFGSGEQSAWWTAEGEIRMIDSRYKGLYHTIVGSKDRMALSVRCVKD